MAVEKETVKHLSTKFETLYGMWRKTKKRGEAMKIWDRRKFPEELVDVMLREAGAQNRQFDKENINPKYIRDLTVWLNNNGWNDSECFEEKKVAKNEKCRCGADSHFGSNGSNRCIDCYNKEVYEKNQAVWVPNDFMSSAKVESLGQFQRPGESIEKYKERTKITGKSVWEMLKITEKHLIK